MQFLEAFGVLTVNMNLVISVYDPLYLTLALGHLFLFDVFIKLTSLMERMLEFRRVRKQI